MLAQDGVIHGLDFMDKTNLHPWRNTLVKPNSNGKVIVGGMNTTTKPIVKQKGTYYCEFDLTRPKNYAKFPCRIETIDVQQPSTLEESKTNSSLPNFIKCPTNSENKSQR